MDDVAKAPKELCEALGRLVLASSALEDGLLDSIVYLDKPKNQKAQLKLSRQPLGALIERFQDAYGKRAALQPITGFCDYLRNLSDERSDFVHAMWMFEPDVPRRYRTKQGGGGLMLNVESIYPDMVHALTSRFTKGTDKLWEIMVPLL